MFGLFEKKKVVKKVVKKSKTAKKKPKKISKKKPIKKVKKVSGRKISKKIKTSKKKVIKKTKKIIKKIPKKKKMVKKVKKVSGRKISKKIKTSKKKIVKKVPKKKKAIGKVKKTKKIVKRPFVNKLNSRSDNLTMKKLDKIAHKIRKEIFEKKNGSSRKIVRNREMLRTGIPGFDALFREKMGGILPGSSVLIEGGPGSGKTLFCLATVNNLCKLKNKKCLYMSFEEPEENLISHMENFNWPAKEMIKKGLLRIKRFDAIDISRSIEALLSAAKKELLIEVDPVFFPQDFQPDFIVIDSLTSIASAFSGEESRFRIYMEQLFRYLEKNNITNFLIREVSSPSHVGTTFKEQGEAVSFLSDGIIILYNVIYDSGERTSAIEILKMRGMDFKRRIVELKIVDGKGIEINPNKVLKKAKKANFSLT